MITAVRARSGSSGIDRDRYIRTDQLQDNLGQRSARSGVVRMSAQAMQVAAYVAGGMILARLLTPADFGLLAMAAALTTIAANLRDFGFLMAAVHEEDLDHRKVSALFWLTVKLSLLVFAAMVLTAPVLAWIFDDERLIAVTIVLALGTLALGLSVQHESLLARQMLFRRLRVIDVGSVVFGLAIAVVLALAGAGYWALVAQLVGMQVVRAGAIWGACGWRPSRPAEAARPAEIRSLTTYARQLTAYRVLIQVSRHLDRVLVAFFGGAAVAGFYYNAYRWALYPVAQIFPPLMTLAVAGLSRVQHDPVAFRAAWRKGMLPVFSVVVPSLLFLSMEARPVILVLLGDQWLEAVPLFQLLCLAAIAMSLERVTKWLYLSESATDRLLRWGLVYAPMLIVAVSIGTRWGATGVAAALAIGSWLLVVPGIAYCLSRSRIHWNDLIAALWRPAAASVIAVLALWSLAPLLPARTLLHELIVAGPVFGLAYTTAWLGFPGGMHAARQMVHSLRALPRTPSPLSSAAGASD